MRQGARDIQVRFFAAAAQLAGCEANTVKPAPGETVKDIAMAAARPTSCDPQRLGQVLDVCSFLSGGALSAPDAPADAICPADPRAAIQLDVLPPFAGG